MGERTWPNLLTALLRGEELADRRHRLGDGRDHGRHGHARRRSPAFAMALRAKGETPAEIAGLVEAMLADAAPVDLPEDVRADAVDVVGTGGDRAHTVNISTMAAIVVAGAGVPGGQARQPGRLVACGTADLLEHLGIPLDLGPDEVARCVAEAGIGFCFAARFHPGMRHAGATRREMGVPTVFNFLGPLTNPARPRAGAVGCFDPRMAPVMAEVFAGRGDSVLRDARRGRAGRVHHRRARPGSGWPAAAPSRETVLDAVDLGLPRCQPGDLRGGDAAFNADVARRVFAGETGPVRDAVLVNAAAALAAWPPTARRPTEARVPAWPRGRATLGAAADRTAGSTASADRSTAAGPAAVDGARSRTRWETPPSSCCLGASLSHPAGGAIEETPCRDSRAARRASAFEVRRPARLPPTARAVAARDADRGHRADRATRLRRPPRARTGEAGQRAERRLGAGPTVARPGRSRPGAVIGQCSAVRRVPV